SLHALGAALPAHGGSAGAGGHAGHGHHETLIALLIRDDEQGMTAALREARASQDEDEVPIGCVIVHEGRIVGRGHNQVEALQDATAHAEIVAIGAASSTLGSWRLGD